MFGKKMQRIPSPASFFLSDSGFRRTEKPALKAPVNARGHVWLRSRYAEYIESMMKQFKLVDMREQYRDLILEAESSAMDYESFLVRLLSVEEEGKRDSSTRTILIDQTSLSADGYQVVTH